MLFNRELNQNFYSLPLPDAGIMLVTTITEEARLLWESVPRFLKMSDSRCSSALVCHVMPHAKEPAGDVAPIKYWNSFSSLEAIEGSQINQQYEHQGWNCFLDKKTRTIERLAIALPKHCLQTQAITQILLIHYAKSVYCANISLTLWALFLTLCTEWQTEMLRTPKALDYISHYENTTVLLEHPTLFLCLPRHAPKCHGILTVTSFSQCHLLPEHPPTSC